MTKLDSTTNITKTIFYRKGGFDRGTYPTYTPRYPYPYLTPRYP